MHRVVVVTGPHRSGTKFVAGALAELLGRPVIWEDQVGFDQDDRICSVMESWSNIEYVIHLPYFAWMLPAASSPDMAVVFCQRDEEGLRDSRRRLLDKDGRLLGVAEAGIETTVLAMKKQSRWLEMVEEGKIHNPYHVQFGSWRWPPSYVPKKDRRGWAVDQTARLGVH